MIARERHNAKARQSTAGGSRKKGKKPAKTHNPAVVADLPDSNAEVHVSKTKEQKEDERKEKMRLELAEQSNSKMNTKKRKRLDKYIDKKLKKEERVGLFEKLSQSQAQLPSTIHLQSSSTLGTGRVSTNKERLERLEDKEVRRAVDGRTGKRHRRGDDYDVLLPGNSDAEDDDGMDVHEDQELPRVDVSVGSALKKDANGAAMAPVEQTRSKGKKTTFRGWKHNRGVKRQASDDGDSESSFDSSDSAYDSAEDDEGSTSGKDTAANEPQPIVRKLGFKDWALKQLSVAKGHADIQPPAPLPTTELAIQEPPSLPPTKKRKIDPSGMRGPLGEDVVLPATSLTAHLRSTTQRKIKARNVTRSDAVVEARSQLPIIAEEQPIMEAILLNLVVIICGETGSGKTTQVPQFLYEAGFGDADGDNPGIIGITQPRRVAAMSMAARVAEELSLPPTHVAYQIRYDATTSPSTAIKFMTDGVLLRELATDFLLSRYSVIVIDEAHERSMNTDILIGVLSRVLKLREELWKEGKAKPLRLIIMSATLRVSDFAENSTLFSTPPPVINVAARQHPVTVHFNRRTPSDYVSECVKKATKIHTRLPPGGILIFLTGQNEIAGVCRKLEARFGSKALDERKRRRRTARSSEDDVVEQEQPAVASAQADVEAEEVELGNAQEDDTAFDVDDDLADDDPDALDSDDERLVDDEELGIDPDESDVPMHIVPLYSLLPSEKQMKVFEPPPAGSRLVVVSTNVAETSLTIPGIRYVIDSGRAKERRYDVANGIQAFQISWTSKASAAQRAGRAGRTGPGHCYRLYSSALFEHYFDSFSQPEILRTPIDGVVLQMKSMHIDAVVNFPFPTPPDRMALRKAETTLAHLGAINISTALSKGSAEMVVNTIGGQITDLGTAMSLFPLSPRFSRMLVSGRQQGCLPYVISIVSALSVGDPFLREEALGGEDEESDTEHDGALQGITSDILKAKEVRRIRRKAFFQSQQTHASLGNGASDLFRMLSVIGAYEYAGGGHKFCAEHFVRPKAMEEIHKLRAQISNIVRANFPDTDPKFVSNLLPPSDLQIKILRQLLAAGFIDQVAARKDVVEKGSSSGNQYSTSKGVAYRAIGISEDVFIHPSSVLFHANPPDFIVFNEVVRTTKLWLKGLTVVNASWLPSLGKPTLCSFSKPAKNSSGTMMVIPRFGPEGWELPAMKADNLH